MAKAPLLSREAKLRANSLLDMLYTPSELAEELGVEQRSIYSRLIPAGTGFAYHQQRRSGFVVEAEEQKGPTAAEIEAALSEAFSAEEPTDLPPSE